MNDSLFGNGTVSNELDYGPLVQRTDLDWLRGTVDGMWGDYKPFADPDFKNLIQTEFHVRFWEMFLGCSLLKQGLTLKPTKGAGPDVKIQHNGGTIWIEAIAPGPGSGDDIVPELSGNGVADYVPNEKATLRLCHAVKTKHDKYKRYVPKYVAPDESFVIAVNGAGVPFWQIDSNIPRVVSAVLPYGNEYALINRKTLELVGMGVEHRPEIKKASGAGVPTTVFEEPDFEGISAILYSTAHVWAFPILKIGMFDLLIHNPLAKNPIPRGTIKVFREYWVENDQLCHSDLPTN